MQILLLSGGSGKRLWPLSNNSRSKQFIKLLNSPDGQKESMVQRVIRQLGESDLKGHVTVAHIFKDTNSISPFNWGNFSFYSQQSLSINNRPYLFP